MLSHVQREETKLDMVKVLELELIVVLSKPFSDTRPSGITELPKDVLVWTINSAIGQLTLAHGPPKFPI